MNIREELLKLVGPDKFTDAPEVLKEYSTDFSLAPPGIANYVVKPEKTEEIQKVIRLANEHSIPVVPVSSRVHFYGATIPKQGGIVLDLTGMNKILEIDELNRRVRIEVGVTWANLKIEYQPRTDRIVLAAVHNLNYALEFLYKVLRLRIGQECLLLNSTNLAAIIAEDGPLDFVNLRASLPAWTLILVVSGMARRPQEKLQYEEEVLGKVISDEFPEISLAEGLPGLPGLGQKLLPMLRKPWPKELTYWKNHYKGACQSLFFIAKPARASRFIHSVEEVAARLDYPITDIGGYLQPIEHNRACHLEFEFFYDPSSQSEVERVRSLYREAAQALLNEGALFTRPYGELAKLVYERAAGYASALRRVKKVFDPQNVMNPGNLCF
jgi:hypothetical protein